MDTWAIIIEFLRTLTSTQIIVGILSILFFILFRKEIRSLIDRLATIKFPGGEISTQSQKAKGEEERPDKPPSIPETASTAILQGIKPEDYQKMITSERANAYLWEFRYLNYFLVYHTQLVLDWFAQLPQGATINFYESMWQPMIPSISERRVVVDVLQQHQLLEAKGHMLEITPKGRAYIDWRGPVPAAS